MGSQSPLEKARQTIEKVRATLPVPVRCCWGSSCGSAAANCAPAAGWCSQSSDHCDHCGGIWCPATAALAGVESSQTRRHGRLRARRLQPGSDNIMLQKLGHVKRSASAEIGIRDTSSKDEL